MLSFWESNKIEQSEKEDVPSIPPDAGSCCSFSNDLINRKAVFFCLCKITLGIIL